MANFLNFQWEVVKKVFLLALPKSGTVEMKCLIHLLLQKKQLMLSLGPLYVVPLCEQRWNEFLNLKQVHRPIQLNCSGLWESQQKQFFDNIPFMKG